jgi:DNA replication and repair protein RecF
MRLRTLHLEQFRSFRSADLTIAPEGFLLIGPNASGKSTILEAVSMLATTRSPRTSAEREIANWQSGQDLGLPAYARLCGEFDRTDGKHRIEIGLVVEGGSNGGLKKRIRFDERPARAVDAVGQLYTVLF